MATLTRKTLTPAECIKAIAKEQYRQAIADLNRTTDRDIELALIQSIRAKGGLTSSI